MDRTCNCSTGNHSNSTESRLYKYAAIIEEIRNMNIENSPAYKYANLIATDGGSYRDGMQHAMAIVKMLIRISLR